MMLRPHLKLLIGRHWCQCRAATSAKRRMVRPISFVLAVMLRTNDCIVADMIKYDFHIRGRPLRGDLYF